MTEPAKKPEVKKPAVTKTKEQQAAERLAGSGACNLHTARQFAKFIADDVLAANDGLAIAAVLRKYLDSKKMTAD